MRSQANQYHEGIKLRIEKSKSSFKELKLNRIRDKLFKNKLLTKIRFSSTVRNGNYCFKANFSNLLKILKEHNVKLTEK